MHKSFIIFVFYAASNFIGSSMPRCFPNKKRVVKISGKVRAVAAVATTPVEEIKEYAFMNVS
jgi:hypothetical protein